MKKSIILISAFSIIALAGFSQDRTPRANARQAAQQARIAEGKRSGEVTQGESALLRSEQRHIRRSERRAKADGEVSIRERRRLERKQDKANRHIRRAKNNSIDNN